jgi:type I restriction enzyme S subunit
MNSLPYGWVRTTLSQVTISDIDRSGPAGAEEFLYVDITSVDNRVKRISSPKRLSGVQAPTRARQRLVPGDVLVSMTRPNLNAIAIVPENMDGAIGSTGFHVLRPAGIEPLWLYYFVQTSDFVKRISESVQGVVYPAVRPKDIERCEVPLAPLGEQRRVVAEIEKQFTRLSAGASALARVRVNLKRYRVSFLRAACRGRLVPTEAELSKGRVQTHEPAHVILQAAREHRLIVMGERNGKRPAEPKTHGGTSVDTVPASWVLATVNQVAEVRLGRQRSPKRHYGPHMRPYLRAANISWDGLDLSDVKEMDFSDEEATTFGLMPGDVLLAEASGSASEVGKPALWNGEIGGCCFQNTVLRVRSWGPLPKFLYYHFLCDAMLGTFGREARGVGIHHLGMKGLSQHVLGIPPLNEQHRIVAELDRRMSNISDIERICESNETRAQKLRASVLSYAFSGRLAMHDPSDQAASALLDTITTQKATRNQTSRSSRALGRRDKGATG